MIERSSWKEFQEAGLLWWVNRALHLFGWAIAVEIADDGENIRDVYPVRCKFRGFDTKSEEQGFARLSKHLHANVDRILEDAPEEPA